MNEYEWSLRRIFSCYLNQNISVNFETEILRDETYWHTYFMFAAKRIRCAFSSFVFISCHETFSSLTKNDYYYLLHSLPLVMKPITFRSPILSTAMAKAEWLSQFNFKFEHFKWILPLFTDY